MLAKAMQKYVLVEGLERHEGMYATQIQGVSFYRSSEGNERKPFVYQSGLIVLGQGRKRIYINEHPEYYDASNYLVVGVPIPLECEAMTDNGEPLLGLSIDIDHERLRRIAYQLRTLDVKLTTSPCKGAKALQATVMETGLEQVLCRLMEALCDPLDANMLAEGILDELVYRVLVGKNGHVLFELVDQTNQYSKVAQALDLVHRQYQQPLTVNQLAAAANMSVSAFHTAFRTVTLETPLQYIKKVRLNKARDLILQQGKRISEAATLVGYSSASQFSREYKRHFSQMPSELMVS